MQSPRLTRRAGISDVEITAPRSHLVVVYLFVLSRLLRRRVLMSDVESSVFERRAYSLAPLLRFSQPFTIY